jgi:hypothetical protein
MTHARIITLAAGLFAANIAACGASGVKYPYITGNDLHSFCHGSSDADQGLCYGYIFGAVDTALIFDLSGVEICIPRGVTRHQLKDVVVSYLDKQPKDRHKTASTLLAMSFVEAFNCKR